MTTHHRHAPPSRGPVVAALVAGLVLSVAVTAVPFVDRAGANVLADHIRGGYPEYSQGRIDSAVTTWLVILTTIGVLGAAGWIVTIRAVHRRAARATWLATSLFVIGTTVALTNLLIRDTSGEPGLPPLLGWTGVLPCLPGLVAVVLLWRRRV